MFLKNRFARLSLMLLAIGWSFSNAVAQSFTEGFESTSPLTDWYIRNNSDTIASTTLAQNWGYGNTNNFTAQAGDPASYLAVGYGSTNSDVGATISNWLFTPARTFSNGDVITFYTRIVASPTSFPDRLELRLSTAGAGLNVGTTSTSVGDFTTLLLTVNPTLSSTGYPGTWTQFTATISGLSGPTAGRVAFRYFVTNGGLNGVNSDYIGIDSYSYTSLSTPPANDNCAGAINLIQGSTCSPVTGNVAYATQSQAACGDGTANDDVWYKFTATSAGANITVDGSTNFDAVVEVFSGSCTGLTSISCTDGTLADGIEAVTVNSLVVGQTYYVRVFDWYSSVPTSTTFTICVTQFTQCDQTQPAGSILETETCGQDLNGGCGMTVPAYQTLTCGQTVFGKAWNNTTNRDTDWYTFTINTPGTATWTATAEFPFTLYFINNSDCANPVVLASAVGAACQTATATYNFTTAGTYVAFIAPTNFTGSACGTYNDYTATLSLPASTPVITAVGSTAICPTGSVVLNATQTGTFQWFNGTTPVAGATTSSITATATGAYTAQVTNNNGCLGPLSAPINVTAAPIDDASFTYPSSTLCSGSANVTPTAALAGTYSATPAGLVINSTTGEINVATSTLGTYTITHSTNVSCPNTANATITLTDNPSAEFSYATSSLCLSASNPTVTFGTGASAGVFSSTTGLSINSATGEINLAASTAGTYSVTNSIAATGSCPAASATATITLLDSPTATISGGGTTCTGSGTFPVTITLSGVGPFDFTYTDGTTPVTITGNAGNTYSFDATSTATYTITSVSNSVCAGTSSGSAVVGVFQNPTVTLDAFDAFCSNSNNVVLDQGLPAGGTYSGNGVSGGALNPSLATTGDVITYTYVDQNGCSGSASAPITIETPPTVTLSAFPTVCSDAVAFELTGGMPAGGTYSGTGVASGQFNPATAGVGTQTIVYNYTSTAGCSGAASQTITVLNCASISENELDANLVIYPNPASNEVMVSFVSPQATNASIQLMTVDGKINVVRELAVGTVFNESFALENFPAGIYLIQVQTENVQLIRRLIVE